MRKPKTNDALKAFFVAFLWLELLLFYFVYAHGFSESLLFGVPAVLLVPSLTFMCYCTDDR